MMPSIESVSTSTPRISDPTTRCPMGSSTSAVIVVPAVPMIVTTFGVSPMRRKARAIGVKRVGWTPRAPLPRTIRFPFGGELLASGREQFGQRFGLADDREEVCVPVPPGHALLVGMRSDPRARPGALVHSQVEPGGAFGSAEPSHARGNENGRFVPFGLREVGEISDVPVRAHAQVARVVGVQVEDDVTRRPAVDDEAVFIAALGGRAERTIRGPVRDGFGLSVDVGHPVRGPEPVVGVFRAGKALRRFLLHTWALVLIAAVMISIASSTGTPLRCSPLRYRKETAPASASSPPAIRVKGTLDFVAVRIFLLNRSSEVSTSTRTPWALSLSATSNR